MSVSLPLLILQKRKEEKREENGLRTPECVVTEGRLSKVEIKLVGDGPQLAMETFGGPSTGVELATNTSPAFISSALSSSTTRLPTSSLSTNLLDEPSTAMPRYCDALRLNCVVPRARPSQHTRTVRRHHPVLRSAPYYRT